jgi:adenine-specific DNA-methyltransferase
MSGSDAQSIYRQIAQSDLYEGVTAYIRLGGRSESSTDPVQIILKKVQDHSRPLGSMCNVNQGILTGVDKIKPSHLQTFPRSGLEKGAGVYVVSIEERSQLDFDSTIFKPWFKKSDIRRFCTTTEPNEFVIYATRDIELPEASSVYRHFRRFEKVIRGRNQDRGEMQAALKQGKWWAIFAARRGVDFEGPKIVCPQRSHKNTFAFNDSPWYASADVYYITPRDRSVELKYVLALVNSTLYFVWLYFKGKRKGEMLELYQKPLSEIPIKRLAPDGQRPFIRLVDGILAAKQRDPEADTSALEREIDELVYAIYGLTKEEKAIVQASAK